MEAATRATDPARTGAEPGTTGPEIANLEDGRLIELYRDGKPAALGVVYERYHDRLVRWITARIHDPHLAEDLAHDTMVRVIRYAATIEASRRTLWPWLKVTARRVIIDHTGRMSSTELPLGDRIPDTPDEDQVRWIADSTVLREALGELPTSQREALLLYHVEQWKSSEIAEVLNRTAPATRQLLYRALKNLRARYHDLTSKTPAILPAPLLTLWRDARSLLAKIRMRIHGHDPAAGAVLGVDGVVHVVVAVAMAAGLAGSGVPALQPTPDDMASADQTPTTVLGANEPWDTRQVAQPTIGTGVADSQRAETSSALRTPDSPDRSSFAVSTSDTMSSEAAPLRMEAQAEVDAGRNDSDDVTLNNRIDARTDGRTQLSDGAISVYCDGGVAAITACEAYDEVEMHLPDS